MAYFDGDTGCKGNCTTNPKFKIGQILYTKGTGPIPPKPSKWDFGLPCKSSSDGDCSNPSPCDFPA